MRDDGEFDVIVVGAGTAGIACAGELVLQGLKPLLICETKEVAYNLRSEWINGNRAMMQIPIVQSMWGGSWWVPLARALDAHTGGLNTPTGFQVARLGDKERIDIPMMCYTAYSMVDVIAKVAPIPIDDHRAELQRVLQAAVMLSYQDLFEMQDVPMVQWLEEQGADPVATEILMRIISIIHCLRVDQAREHVTLLGGVGFLRSIFGGDCIWGDVEPDYREGVWIPIAQAVERKGGVIWRGCKVDRVLTEGGTVQGVLLQDGTEVRARTVAIATGNPRIPKLLDPVPVEVENVQVDWGEHAQIGFYKYALLGREVLPESYRHWFGVIGFDPEWSHWMWPCHVRSPWDMEPGKQLLGSLMVWPEKRIAEEGGEDAIFERMAEIEEFYFPGYRDAIEEVSAFTRPGGMWFSQALGGTKLQRRSESVEGLWYVGDGSVPIAGVWTEAAVSAGVLGAREIAVEHRKHN